MTARNLKQQEGSIANGVFGMSVRLNRVLISDLFLAESRAFVTPRDPTPLGLVFGGGFTINVGPSRYPDLTTSEKNRKTLVHELVHCWQGQHSPIACSYIFDSLWHRSLNENAYDYVIGEPWESYNAEQQANLVAEWYIQGASETDTRYPYIRDYIRRGRFR